MMMNITTLDLWTRSYPQPLVPPLLASFNHQIYLAVMGLEFLAWRKKKKMEVKSFDGFEIVSINSSARRHHNLPQSEILRFRDDIDKRILSIERRPSNSSYNVFAKSSISTVSFNFLTAITTTLGLNLVGQWVLAANQRSCRWMINTHSAKGCWITVVAKLNRIKTSISSSCEFVCPLLSYHEYSLLYSIYEKFSYDSIKIINMMWWRQWKWQWLSMNNEWIWAERSDDNKEIQYYKIPAYSKKWCRFWLTGVLSGIGSRSGPSASIAAMHCGSTENR